MHLPSLVLAGCLCAATAGAQAVRGRVITVDQGKGIPEVEVRLLADSTHSVATTRTDSLGRYLVPAPAGRYRIGIRRLGIRGDISQPFQLDGRDTMEVIVRTEPVSLRLAGILIKARADPVVDFSRGFEQRRLRNAGGIFLDRSAIGKKGAPQLLDVLRGIAGIEVITKDDEYPTGLTVVSSRGGRSFTNGGAGCEVSIFVDGFDEVASIVNRTYRSSDIEAIEVYSVSQVPSEFKRPGAQNCGVILMWTRTKAGAASDSTDARGLR
ncbi:MAG: carboxypeptidase regulatory-like domain-containing protein [Gemmatimonadetes bacterium]|nr:carboxypeptidase regulatory-like domain-containing protein [Gemmatimonadota bacterium]